MITLYRIIVSIFDLLIAPFLFVSALLMHSVRKYIIVFWVDYSYFKISRRIFNWIGVFPIIDHYYDPQFRFGKIKNKRQSTRRLTGLEMNINEQLILLNSMDYNDELVELNSLPASKLTYSFHKGPFRSGDSEFLYSFLRLKKPKTIIEIGCGKSSLVIQHALSRNKKQDKAYTFEHICIEPYENEWLNELDVIVKKELVESIPLEYFDRLKSGDILFIDSSHIIRSEGDVLYEILELLPSLNVGVYIHIHDIFTPNDYLPEWKSDGMLFWNEQYLLEAFLSNNVNYKIIGAINHLKHEYYDDLKRISPFLSLDREPGSFWIQKIA